MPELTEEQRRSLDALRLAYEAELPDKISRIVQAAGALGREGDKAGVEELHQLVHRLAGSSAIWGFTRLSEAAGELERIVLDTLAGTRRPGERADAVGRLIADLQHAAAMPVGAPPVGAPRRSRT